MTYEPSKEAIEAALGVDAFGALTDEERECWGPAVRAALIAAHEAENFGAIYEALRYGEAALEADLGIAYVTFSTEDGLGRTNDKREQLARIRAALEAVEAHRANKG